MEPRLFISPPRTSPSIPSLPLFISYKSSILAKPKLSSKTYIGLSREDSEKTPFLGKSFGLLGKIVPSGNLGNARVPFGRIRAAAVKRRKEGVFDNVIQRDKKLKLVMKIRKILVSQPNRIMSLRDLGRYRRALGLQKRRRFIALLRKFPAVFEIVEEGAYSLHFKLTPEAERLYLEEMRIRNEMEDILVVKLRKLLMMSSEKRILLEKIAHLKTDFGLPLEFQDTICRRYPQYFKVVMTGRGPALELTHWDPELAVSAAELAEEENRTRDLEANDLIIDRPPKFNRVKLPRGLNLSKGEMRRICQFRDMPYVSPFSDFSALKSGTLEKEKHACGVVHEILSLTVEKRTLVDHLTHFRDEFRFSQQLRGMLIRHPDMFYVSLKGDRDSVFLREAYHDSQLIEKDRLLLIKEKLRSLIAVPRFPRRTAPGPNEDGAEGTDEPADGSGGEDGEEWSDIDDAISDDFDDDEDGEEFEDDWSDEDDEIPPDFDEDGGSVYSGVSQSAKPLVIALETSDKDSINASRSHHLGFPYRGIHRTDQPRRKAKTPNRFVSSMTKGDSSQEKDSQSANNNLMKKSEVTRNLRAEPAGHLRKNTIAFKDNVQTTAAARNAVDVVLSDSEEEMQEPRILRRVVHKRSKSTINSGKHARKELGDKIFEMPHEGKSYGEELVGRKIKVWWPLDRAFYEGAIYSFNPRERKHRVLYADGDEEILDLSQERWVLIGKNNPEKGQETDSHSDPSFDRPKNKKAKILSQSSTKEENAFSSSKNLSSSGVSGSKSKVQGPKCSSKSENTSGLDALTFAVDKLQHDASESYEKPNDKEQKSNVKSNASALEAAKPKNILHKGVASGDLPEGKLHDSDDA